MDHDQRIEAAAKAWANENRRQMASADGPNLRRAMSVAIAAYLAGDVVVPEWQTIESAPKDGTEVIGVHFTDWGNSRPSIYGPWTVAFVGGQWRSSWDGSRVVDYMSDFGTEYKEPDLPPTHWMPLPSVPDGKSGEENG